MLHKLNKRNDDGFTIIEVLIVLAIAGLILLVVFMAVPALQRNSRNTQRKNDVSSILGAVQEYTNNNGGVLPTTAGTFAAQFPGVQPKFGYYTTAANITWAPKTTPTVPTYTANVDKIVIANNATCNATGTAAVTTNATSRTVVVLYAVEGSSGPVMQCLQS